MGEQFGIEMCRLPQPSVHADEDGFRIFDI